MLAAPNSLVTLTTGTRSLSHSVSLLHFCSRSTSRTRTFSYPPPLLSLSFYPAIYTLCMYLRGLRFEGWRELVLSFCAFFTIF